MSCTSGCNPTPTISCNPCPSASTGCLDYISTDCVQFLGASNSIGFNILQNDSLTTIITKISGATIAPNIWIPVSFSAPSASTYSGYTPQVTVNYTGEVRFTGIASVSSATASLIISNPYISASTYYPATTKAFIVTYSGTSYLVTIAASTGVITVLNLSGTTSWQILIDFSKFWYDKNI